MGGTKDPASNSPANILLLCGSGTTGCHGWVESHREEAYESGFLVRRGNDPGSLPVTTIHGHVLLGNDGGWQPC